MQMHAINTTCKMCRGLAVCTEQYKRSVVSRKPDTACSRHIVGLDDRLFSMWGSGQGWETVKEYIRVTELYRLCSINRLLNHDVQPPFKPFVLMWALYIF